MCRAYRLYLMKAQNACNGPVKTGLSQAFLLRGLFGILSVPQFFNKGQFFGGYFAYAQAVQAQHFHVL